MKKIICNFKFYIFASRFVINLISAIKVFRIAKPIVIDHLSDARYIISGLIASR